MPLLMPAILLLFFVFFFFNYDIDWIFLLNYQFTMHLKYIATLVPVLLCIDFIDITPNRTAAASFHIQPTTSPELFELLRLCLLTVTSQPLPFMFHVHQQGTYIY